MSTLIYIDKHYYFTYMENKYQVRRTYDKAGVCIGSRFRIWGKNMRGLAWVNTTPKAILRDALLEKCIN